MTYVKTEEETMKKKFLVDYLYVLRITVLNPVKNLVTYGN